MATEIYAARAMVMATAAKADRGDNISVEANMCKLFTSEASFRVGPGRGELFRERPEEFLVQQADGERGDLDDPRGHAELDAGLAILFVGAPPRSLSSNALRTHVLTDFEDGIAEALALRFTQQATDEPPHRHALRASVLARASVAAVRSALIAYSSDDTPDADNPSADDFRALLQEAFEVLRGAA